ncbi:phosphoglycerate kinase [Candidatus Falkowbacteria bacterium]|nr:phosphoglycerate kinase [Candidatus Falkowbacteria bacterium]
MPIRSMRQLKDVAGKVVFLRVDFNVPLANGKVKEDYKIIAGLATIRFLLRYDAKVVIATHLGDPGGKRSKKYTTEPVAKRLEKLLGRKVVFVKDCVGPKVEKAVSEIKPGQVIFLENLRFYPGEEKDDKQFARQLARPADLYINNAFAVSHRAHASVSAIKSHLPSYAGLLLEQEVNSIERALKPKKPLVVVIGGAKIGTKLPIISNFIKNASQILVGGAVANDFLQSLGYEVGKSKVSGDPKLAKQAVAMYKKAGNKKIILPLDLVVSKKKDGKGALAVRSVSTVGKDEYIYDIGPKTISFYSRYLKQANTIAWNGPMGWFEQDSFKHGTVALARVMAARSSGRAFGVVGGGETVEALKMAGMFDQVDWVSTGGGAMLDFLAGEPMPGLKGIIK